MRTSLAVGLIATKVFPSRVSSPTDMHPTDMAAELSESAHRIMVAAPKSGHHHTVRQHDTFIVNGAVVGSGDFVP
jgi:hypothetical protein